MIFIDFLDVSFVADDPLHLAKVRIWSPCCPPSPKRPAPLNREARFVSNIVYYRYVRLYSIDTVCKELYRYVC